MYTYFILDRTYIRLDINISYTSSVKPVIPRQVECCREKRRPMHIRGENPTSVGVARLEGEKRGSALVVDGGSSAADVPRIFRPGKVIHKNTTRCDIFIMWTI